MMNKTVRNRLAIMAISIFLIPICWAIGQPGRPDDCMSGRFVYLRLHYPYGFAIGQEEDAFSILGLRIGYPTSYRRAIAGFKNGWNPEIKILRGEAGWSDKYCDQTWTCHGEMLISLNKSSWERELERRRYCKERGTEP